MKAEHLEREFADRAVPHCSGSLCLRPPDALALVGRAAEEGVPIMGVDGLAVTPSSTTSAIEHTADFSSAIAGGHGCWEDAEAFIRQRAALGLVFEFALGDDPLEAV